MPRKRRMGKRRLDWRAELECWSTMFECGFAFDGDLIPLGYQVGTLPDRATIQEAWRRLGGAYIAEHGRMDGSGECLAWALEQFGAPDNQTQDK